MNLNRHRWSMFIAVLLTSLVFLGAAHAEDKYLPAFTIIKDVNPEPPSKVLSDMKKEKAAKAKTPSTKSLTPLDGIEAITMSGMRESSGISSDPEIAELARGLHYEPVLMYKFVHDNIQYNGMWGDQKGAYMALMDRSGTSYDQASLLIDLLKEAEAKNGQPGINYTVTNPRYVVGNIEITGAQTTTWWGIPDNYYAAHWYKEQSGMSAEVFYNSGYTINRVELLHVWVKVTINSVDYELDPSFKSHTIIDGLDMDDLESAMQYDRDQFITNASQGAVIPPSDPYIANLNKTNIANDLVTYSTNLINYIKTNDADACLDDIIGGKSIDPIDEASPLPTSLPYTVLATPSPLEYTTIPESNRTKLTIAHEGINKIYNSSDIYGRRLSIKYNSSNRPELWLDGTLEDTGNVVTSGQPYDIVLTVDHPYTGQSGGYADQTIYCNVVAGGFYHIANGWGDTNTHIIEKHRQDLAQYFHDGYADDSEEVLGESFLLNGLTWLAQNSKTRHLLATIADCTVFRHHYLGVTGANQGLYIDMPGGFGGIAPHSGVWTDGHPLFFALGLSTSAFEHGVIQQLQDYKAVSTVKLMDIGNSSSTYNKTFEATSANWETGVNVKSQLVGYDASEIASVESYLQSGHTVYLPQNGDLGEPGEDWQGIGFLGVLSNSTQLSGAYIISGGYKGGFASSSLVTYDPGYVWDSIINNSIRIEPPDLHSLTNDPIDMVTGSYLYNNSDITIGTGGYPFGLDFTRHYNSVNHLSDGPLGLGWSHNFDISTSVGSDSFQALGADSVTDAAANIAALYVTYDLLTSQSLIRNVAATISQMWLMDHMIDNIVTLKTGKGNQQFVKLAEGSYNPPPGSNARLEKETDNSFILRNGDGTVVDFDVDGKATEWSDAHDNTVEFAYLGDKLSSVTSMIGGTTTARSLTFTYSGDYITQVTDSAGRYVSFSYDAKNQLETFTDLENEVTTYEYADDIDGEMTKIFYPTDPLNPFVSSIYDPLGRVIHQTNANGQTYDYFYSYYCSEELEPMQTNPQEQSQRYSKIFFFNEHGREVGRRDQLGRESKTQYDGHLRPKRVISPTGTSVEYTYDHNHNVIETCSKPIETSGLPDIVQIATYTTHETFGTIDRWFNKLTSQTDSAGNTTTYEYDFSDPVYTEEYGDLRKITLPTVTNYKAEQVTATQQFTYNTYGQADTVIDPNGIITKFEYYLPTDPERGALKKTIVDFGTNPENLNIATEVTYDNVGNVITTKDAKNNIAQSEYSPSRRLKKSISPAPFNYETHYEYYEDGKIKQVKQQMGTDIWQVTEYTYTPSREQETVKGPYKEDEPTQENFTQFTYDSLDRLWKVTDAENNITETRYYPDGQVWKTIDAEGHDVITYTYNPDGTLYSVHDAKGTANTTIYTYDDFKRPLRTTYADGTYEEITYDSFGRIFEIRNRAGDIAQFTYDALNRIVSKTTSGTPVNTTTYGYDISGRTVTTTDNAGSLRNTYDRLGQLSTVTQVNGFKVSYLYNELGQRTRLTYPDNSYITYSYDNMGRLTNIKDQYSKDIASYGYDNLSQRVSVFYGNGIGTRIIYRYSNSNRLIQLNNITKVKSLNYGYTYDLVGNREVMLVNGTEQHTYTYDNIYQLTNADYPDDYFQGDTIFTYDSAGNRSQVDNPPTTYTTNNLNQYTYAGSTVFSYDNNGNLTGIGSDTYTYDAENQLISANVSGQSIQYTYDAAGRRVIKNIDGEITKYVYDGDQVIAEYDGSDTLLRSFVYGAGIDEPVCIYAYNLLIGDITDDGLVNIDDFLALAQKWLLTNQDIGYTLSHDLNRDGKIDNSDIDILAANWKKTPEPVQVFYYHFDGLGSVIALSDTNGNVVGTYVYDVYGQCQVKGPAIGNPYRFTGRRWDEETGLYYYRARYYNPIIGRFMQTDPIGYADGINWYSYVGNNPIILIDPSGLCGSNSFKYSGSFWADFGTIVGDELWQSVRGIPRSVVTAPGDYYNRFREAGVGRSYSVVSTVILSVGKVGGFGTMAEGLVGVDVRSGTETHGWQRVKQVGFGGAQAYLLAYSIASAIGGPGYTPSNVSSSPSTPAIDAPVKGKYPSWSTVKRRYWQKNYGHTNPPKHPTVGVSKELHHIKGQNIPRPHAESNLQELWPWEHAKIDPYRYYKGPVPGN